MNSRKTFSNSKAKLPGSNKELPADYAKNSVDPNEYIRITIRLRRSRSLQTALKKLKQTGKIFTRKEFEAKFGASKTDMRRVEDFVIENELTIIEKSYARCTMIVCGTVQKMSKAFSVSLYYCSINNERPFRGRSGSISIPRNLIGIIIGVFGLDDRIQTVQASKLAKSLDNKLPLAPSGRFYANELAKFYNFPQGTGSGQCIGLIQLGGGFLLSDMRKYFRRLKLPMPLIKSVSIDGAFNEPGINLTSDGEVTLDVQVAGAIAPKSTIVLYFAPNTDEGLLNAITFAIHDNVNKPSILSISWANSEKRFTEQSKNNINDAFKEAAILGITICVASGDAGATANENDGLVHAIFPASSPFVIACGGTQINSKSRRIYEEVVWNLPNGNSGGGISDFFPIPDYQKNATIPPSKNVIGILGRGIPDVSAIAERKYKTILSGQTLPNGGTSAVAPLVAGLIARINAIKKSPIGFINPELYENASAFRDIITGDNLDKSTQLGYTAGIGWDACTGLGAIDGGKIAKIFIKIKKAAGK